MDRIRGEVIWETLSYSQRIALKNSLTSDYHFDPKERWSRLTPCQQAALLKIDWEFTLGVRFPQLNSKKEK